MKSIILFSSFLFFYFSWVTLDHSKYDIVYNPLEKYPSLQLEKNKNEQMQIFSATLFRFWWRLNSRT